ncbi:MAG: DMT family transporter [Muribaculaceae bacterium]|nr:DMT family transporter [Muribaculaceae bacterium]
MPELKTTLRSNSNILFANLGAIFVVIAWGTSFLSSKVLMVSGGFTPVEVFVYRFVFAYLLLLIFTYRKIFSNNWKDELLFLVCGLCAGSIYFVSENYALEYTTTGNVSLLVSISPIFTTILMAIIYRFMPALNVIIGSIIAFIGVACIIFSAGESFEINPKGDLIALCASLSWAIYTIVIKRLTPHYTTLFITRKLFFYGVITSLPLLFIQEAPLHLNLLFDFSQPHYIFNFVFLGLFCSCFAYLIWNEVMKILGPVKSNNYLYGQPLVTMLAGYFILEEQIYVLGYIGCVLIIGGIMLSDKWQIKKS